MFIKKDTRKVSEILSTQGDGDSEDSGVFKFARRTQEFKGDLTLLSRHRKGLAAATSISLYNNELNSLKGIHALQV